MGCSELSRQCCCALGCTRTQVEQHCCSRLNPVSDSQLPQHLPPPAPQQQHFSIDSSNTSQTDQHATNNPSDYNRYSLIESTTVATELFDANSAAFSDGNATEQLHQVSRTEHPHHRHRHHHRPSGTQTRDGDTDRFQQLKKKLLLQKALEDLASF